MNKVGVRSTELTLVDYPTVDDRLPQGNELKSSGRMKQEVKSMIHSFFIEFYIRYI